MADRIVVSFRMPFAGLSPVTGRGYPERVRALAQRAEALGAELLSFGAESCSFGVEPDAFEEAITLATSGRADTQEGEIAWCVGVAQGDLLPIGSEGLFAWGVPLVAAETLARIGEPGDVLADESLRALGALVTIGRRRMRIRGRPVRGLRVDPRQPWRAAAEEQIGRMVTPPLIGREDPSALLWMPGSRAVLRADPGLGGTRLLAEVERLVAPGPCLVIAPSGSGLEPLGALRRGLARARAPEIGLAEAELDPAMRRLVAGDGVPIDIAAAIVASFLRGAGDDAPHGALLVDDAVDVDAASLDACARALAIGERPFSCVLRVDATGAPPPQFAQLVRGPEMELKPFDETSAERLASDAVGGRLDPACAKRWARRGSYTPLGILEALALGLASGELSWNGEAYAASRRTEGRGKPLPARDWIARRAQMMTSPIEQVIVAMVAFVGGQVQLERVQRVLAAANVSVDAAQEAAKLVARRWLVEPQRGWVALPTRSHREAILGVMRDESLQNLIHLAIGHVLAQEERGLGLAEAAHHLARGGDAPLAAQVALTAARVAMSLDLSAGAAHLFAFAREQDPSVAEEARAELAHSLPPQPIRTSTLPSLQLAEDSVPPPHDSEPPTVAVLRAVEADSTTLAAAAPVADGDATTPHERPPVSRNTAPLAAPGWASAPQTPGSRPPPMSSHRGRDSTLQPPETTSDPPRASAPPISDVAENVGQRLSDLAKEALLGADTRALERWTEGLRATGDRGRFAERMQAIVRLARGDVGEALRVLRAARAELDASASAAQRCQASLALGFALAVAHRPDEALLEALDALSRARESGDDKGAHACLAFLAKLYASVERGDDAARLRKFAKIAEDRGPPLEEVPM